MTSDPQKISTTRAEGVIPLWSFEGTARECGHEYAKRTMAEFPAYRSNLEGAAGWKDIKGEARKIVEARAPFLFDLHAGMAEAAGTAKKGPSADSKDNKSDSGKLHKKKSGKSAKSADGSSGCTSFAVSWWNTVDGFAITGQTKDTPSDRMNKYIVLRMRMTDGPTILVLAYPGETLGYGMWSTGMSLYRNNLVCKEGGNHCKLGLPWAYLALAGTNIHDAVALAKEYGLGGCGNYFIADGVGESVDVEWNAGGMNFIYEKDGINTHANHPLGPDTSKYNGYPEGPELECSRYRTFGLYEKLKAQGRHLTPQSVLGILMDHTDFPKGGICRHQMDGNPNDGTTAVIIAEPQRGRVHVVKGRPCENWGVTYTV
jgi:hypothetical protein